MALATNRVDINRATTGLVLNPEQSAEIWAKAAEESAIMRLSRQVELPGSGIAIPVVTGDPVADFVVESAEKPVSNSTFTTKTMVPFKIAVIELMSKEFLRDFDALAAELVRRLPYSIGRKFDQTIAYGTAPGTGFDVLTNATAVSLTPPSGGSVYQQLVTTLETVGAGGYSLDGWAIAPQAYGTLLGAVDGNGRPLLIDSVNDDREVGRILGAPVIRTKNVYNASSGTGVPNMVGLAGDWSQSRYGVVNGIEVATSEEATINTGTEQVNLWQRNMVAFRVEAEVGFVVSDSAAFVRLTTAAN